MGKLYGLLVIAVSLLLVVLAARATHRTPRLVLAVVAIAIWLVALLSFAALLTWEDFDVGSASLNCAVPGHDSEYAPSHWS